jgi:hypothetical protein
LNIGGKDEGAYTKDRLEDKLGKLVRSGTLDLKTAQKAETGNWVQAYLRYVGPLPDYHEAKPMIDRRDIFSLALGVPVLLLLTALTLTGQDSGEAPRAIEILGGILFLRFGVIPLWDLFVNLHEGRQRAKQVLLPAGEKVLALGSAAQRVAEEQAITKISPPPRLLLSYAQIQWFLRKLTNRN